MHVQRTTVGAEYVATIRFYAYLGIPRYAFTCSFIPPVLAKHGYKQVHDASKALVQPQGCFVARNVRYVLRSACQCGIPKRVARIICKASTKSKGLHSANIANK